MAGERALGEVMIIRKRLRIGSDNFVVMVCSELRMEEVVLLEKGRREATADGGVIERWWL